MAGELLTQFTAADLFRETSAGYDHVKNSAVYATSNGGARGVRLNKFVIASQLYEYYNLIAYVPAAIALGTGLTFKLLIVDDGTAGDPGLVAKIEITPFNLSASGALVDWSVSGSKGTATTGNVTLQSTSGQPKILSIAIANAALASLAATNILGVRIRRVGDDSADTAQGSVILLGGCITNT